MIFLMDLPDPVHGMSNVNLAVLKNTINLGIKPKVINTVPSYASKFFTTKLWGGFKLLHTLLCYIRLFFTLIFNIGGVVYRPINGGVGQVYDLVYLLLSRLFNNQIYVHHHSFNYLNSHSKLFVFVNKLAGKSAIHIVLGERMGTLLNKLYGINDDNIKVVSNLAFFDTKQQEYIADDAKQIRIGHLANLCVEKGVDIFIDVCRTLCDKKMKFTAVVAGPCVDDNTKKLVLDAVEEIPQLKYVGPLYHQEKKSFYEALDCFIFPSKYKNEAEPLVLYEAAINGSFLVGTKRGCMEEVIGKFEGFSSDEHSCIVSEITKVIILEQEKRGFDLENKAKRLNLFQHEQIKANESLLSFIKEMEFHELSKAR